MREQLERFFMVLAVGSTVAIVAKRGAVPYNVALVIVGLLLVFLDLVPSMPLDPELVLVLFLPVLVFEAALSTDIKSLRQAAAPILALALPGVAVSLLGTAAVATWLLALPFALALLLGAVLAITDTVSVLLAFRSVRVPHRLQAIMEGESLFNDGTALVLVSLATTVVASGRFDAVQTLHALAIAILGGVLVGAAVGALGASVLRQTPDHLTAILASLVFVFSASLAAESIHASSVVAVVVAGVFVGRAARRVLEPSRLLALQGFWETAGFSFNVLIFLLVGMQLRASDLLAEAGSIALALLALHVGRAIAVYGCFGALRLVRGEKVPARWQHVMVLGNIKGGLSVAAVMALPQDLPHRERLVSVVFGVTFVTLLSQALPFRSMLRRLKVASAATNGALDQAKAVLIEARRGQSELDELLSAGLVSRKDHANRRAAFQRQVIAAEATLRGPDAEEARDELAELAILSAQKSALLDAARRGLISEDVANQRAGDIDRKLVGLQNLEPKDEH